MYSLNVLMGFVHPDGRIFDPDHPCKSLDAFEVAELVTDYPEHFDGADEITKDFIANSDNIQHLADAVKRKQAEQGLTGSVKARKQ